MGNDKELKAGRLQEAEKFLQSETIEQMIEKEGRNPTQQFDYSNTEMRLKDIATALQMPTVLNKGVQFDISQHIFDPYFQDKIKELFTSRIATAQNDAAYRSLRMVCKELNTTDA